MMKKFAVVPAVAAGLVLVCGTAFALEPYLPRSAKVFGRLDADGNGKITAAEVAPRAEKRLLAYDADKNGAVSAAEIDAMMQKALEKRRARIMQTLDANKDGAITEAELDKVVEAMLNGADTDKDGGVSLQEAQNFRVSTWRKAYLAGAGTP